LRTTITESEINREQNFRACVADVARQFQTIEPSQKTHGADCAQRVNSAASSPCTDIFETHSIQSIATRADNNFNFPAKKFAQKSSRKMRVRRSAM
jgi:hypothetical protein